MKDNGRIRKRHKNTRRKQVRKNKRVTKSIKRKTKRGGVIFGVLDKSLESDMAKNINRQYDTPMYVQPYGVQERKSMLLLDEKISKPPASTNNASFNLHSYEAIANLANRLKQTTHTIKINETYVGKNWETKWNERDAVVVAQQLADKFDKEQKKKSELKKKSTRKKKSIPKRISVPAKKTTPSRKSTQKNNIFQSFWNWFIY